MPGRLALEPRPCHWLAWSTGLTLACGWSTSRDAETADEFGQIDVLVNNAALQRTYDEPEEVPDEDWDRYFQTNVPAMYHLCKAAKRRFVDVPGKARKRQEREAQFRRTEGQRIPRIDGRSKERDTCDRPLGLSRLCPGKQGRNVPAQDVSCNSTVRC